MMLTLHFTVSKPINSVEAAANSLKCGIYRTQSEKKTITDSEVFSEEDLDFGGWIVIQRRKSGSIAFYRIWYGYKQGFGKLPGSYWISSFSFQSHKWSLWSWSRRCGLEGHYRIWNVILCANNDINNPKLVETVDILNRSNLTRWV